jgi:cell division protein FtsW (lipid II flippase)
LFFESSSPTDRIQGRLLLLAGLFLFLFAVTLSLSPAGRARSWDATYRWDHWIGLFIWVVIFAAAHVQTSLRLPDRDPFILPAAALLSGWGLLTIWRLMPVFGQRQALWLVIALVLFLYALRLPSDLEPLRRYKYLWLTGGLILTALTFLVGTNPTGPNFPRLWLGGPLFFIQPSEPLKLLLVMYLAAYLAGSSGKGAAPVVRISSRLLPLLAPTLVMTGLAMLLLFFQRDLGTATLFLFLYATMVYLASGRKAVLVFSVGMLLISAAAGYTFFDVVRLRVDAWLNPWLDPAGRSYQVVQALLSISNGGIFGRGPGLGSPGLVPVPHSDFIYTALVEETGLVGSIGLIGVLTLLCTRGLRAAIGAPDSYRRYLAAGLTAFLIGQSILIIGGNLRLLPLTGVTLPFVSYGGSSLVTAFLSLVLLLHVSNYGDAEPRPVRSLAPYLQLGGLLFSGLALSAILTGWWTVVRGPDLLTRTDNLRMLLSDRFVPRGDILDRQDQLIVRSTRLNGIYTRTHYYPELSLVSGYTHPAWGQSGIEASLNDYLRGLAGYPQTVVWSDHLLYGQPPPGLDVRLTIDLGLQQVADDLLRDRQSAAVLLNAQTGEILVLASHPNFDPNILEEVLPEIINDPLAPLLNRATQGLYQPGTALAPLLLAFSLDPDISSGRLPPLPENLAYTVQISGQQVDLDCAAAPEATTWEAVLRAGCPAPLVQLGEQLLRSQDGEQDLLDFFQRLGVYQAPLLRLPSAASARPGDIQSPAQYILGQGDLRVSPLQMALAISSLSGNGIRPAPRLAAAYESPQVGWTAISRLEEPERILPAGPARQAAELLSAGGSSWHTLASAIDGEDRSITWYLGGTSPGWTGTPLALVVLLEEQDSDLALQVGEALLAAGMQP